MDWKEFSGKIEKKAPRLKREEGLPELTLLLGSSVF
jgi:hypothetical protein